ncbi:MAG: peptide chain release factor N(5)-glutamine methyltransferase [Treponema sp.]|jgi:release factor glutamine methyltransferase|nr:peptide chain release factor N(5)-glutamine methyltransferase [Treponema sp.]
MTIREAIKYGSVELKYSGIENPSLDVSLLLGNILGKNRATLIASGTDPLSDEALAQFNSHLERRKQGECVAYITKIKEFWGLEFLVNHSVLVPRPDTELLVETALEIIKKEQQNFDSQRSVPCAALPRPQSPIIDLCTGSGAVAIALKHEMPELEVHASDISAEALEVAKTNAVRLLPPGSIIQFYLGNLFNAKKIEVLSQKTNNYQLTTNNYFLITANPPYVPTNTIKILPPEVQKEPRIALDGGETGLEIIKQIIKDAPNYLISGGILLMEADPRLMEKITNLLTNRGFCDIKLHKDLSGLERVIGGKYEK